MATIKQGDINFKKNETTNTNLDICAGGDSRQCDGADAERCAHRGGGRWRGYAGGECQRTGLHSLTV